MIRPARRVPGGRARGTVLAMAGLLVLGTRAATAQERGEIRVVDERGMPVGFAVIRIGSGTARIADSSGTHRLRESADSLQLHVRRIGHAPFDGWVRRDPEGRYAVVTARRIVALDTVRVSAREVTPLETRGFYDRMQRVQRGAILGEFVTPEELDERVAGNTSEHLAGLRYVRVGRRSGRGRSRPVILGRGGCAMTLVVDGQQVHNLISAEDGAPTSISGGGTTRLGAGDLAVDIDEAVDGRAIMAIEVYPSTANAPAELQTLGGRGSCGIVAIWTGTRR